MILNQIFNSLSPDLQRTYNKITNLQHLWNAIKTNQTRTDTDAQNLAVKAYMEMPQNDIEDQFMRVFRK